MAKIEIVQPKTEESPESVECIEVRIWGVGGKKRQQFLIGNGVAYDGSNIILLEILYTVNGIQFFHTRNYLQLAMFDPDDGPFMEGQFRRFEGGETDTVGFGDMLPETSILLERSKFTYHDMDDKEVSGESYILTISADVGVIFAPASPGARLIEIKFPYIHKEEGLRFLQDLAGEIEAARQGRHPNPADLPDGASDWSFIRRLNEKAYDQISVDYQESYFSNPALTSLFDAWLADLPTNGHVLDAGCGHGDPVISRLLEKGFRVTGTDLSPRMLGRAAERFPGVRFLHQTVGEIREEAVYDGACSLSSLLYLDPIDLSHGIHRLFRALKPGGLLFLFAHDLHPNWRGLPYQVDINQWMWSWTYGMEEAARALEEFGYFKVLKVEDVSTAEEKEKRIALWRKAAQENYEKYKKFAEALSGKLENPAPDLSHAPEDLAYTYVIIARREPG